MAIEALDVLYVPSRDVEADLNFCLDGEDDVRPEHVPVVHRVSDLDETLTQLSARGLRLEGRVELPLGPCATFRSPGGQRLGLYELTRPEVDEHFAGRADF